VIEYAIDAGVSASGLALVLLIGSGCCWKPATRARVNWDLARKHLLTLQIEAAGIQIDTSWTAGRICRGIVARVDGLPASNPQPHPVRYV